MLNPDDLRKMTPAQLAETLRTMAEDYYDTRSFRAKLADDFNLTAPTISRWMATGNGIEWGVLFTLDRWLNGEKKAMQVVRGMQMVDANLLVAADAMAAVAKTLRQMQRQSDACLYGNSAASPAASEAVAYPQSSEA